jgi:hypothetical protein
MPCEWLQIGFAMNIDVKIVKHCIKYVDSYGKTFIILTQLTTNQ